MMSVCSMVVGWRRNTVTEDFLGNFNHASIDFRTGLTTRGMRTDQGSFASSLHLEIRIMQRTKDMVTGVKLKVTVAGPNA